MRASSLEHKNLLTLTWTEFPVSETLFQKIMSHSTSLSSQLQAPYKHNLHDVTMKWQNLKTPACFCVMRRIADSFKDASKHVSSFASHGECTGQTEVYSRLVNGLRMYVRE